MIIPCNKKNERENSWFAIGDVWKKVAKNRFINANPNTRIDNVCFVNCFDKCIPIRKPVGKPV